MAFCLISKYLIFRERPRGLVAEAGFSSCSPLYSERLIVRTDTYWRPSPFRSKATSPAAVANKVWSVPRPTFRPGVKFGSSLAYKNHAANNLLAAELLHAQTPASRIAAVARRTACLFVSHNLRSETCCGRPIKGTPTFNLPIARSNAPGNCRSTYSLAEAPPLSPGRRRRSECRSPARS